jgi:molecular chaperone Hsp33
MQDRLVRATAAQGTLRAVGAVTTESARHVQRVHRATPLAAAAMGRLVTSAALLAADLKDRGSVHVELLGDGPIGRVIAEAYADGLLRARADHPDVDLPLRADGKLAVGQAVGRTGHLSVRRDPGYATPYTSVVPLTSGEVGDDLATFLTQSDQVPSAVAVGVLVGRDGWVTASGGILVQALPGADARLVERVAERFSGLDRLSQRLADGETLEAILATVLPPPVHFGEERPLHFGCRCSRERARALLGTLSPADREDMVRQGGAEVVCHYCETAYRFGPDALAPETARAATRYD